MKVSRSKKELDTYYLDKCHFNFDRYMNNPRIFTDLKNEDIVYIPGHFAKDEHGNLFRSPLFTNTNSFLAHQTLPFFYKNGEAGTLLLNTIIQAERWIDPNGEVDYFRFSIKHTFHIQELIRMGKKDAIVLMEVVYHATEMDMKNYLPEMIFTKFFVDI